VSIYSSVGNLPTIPARDYYTAEQTPGYAAAFIDVATSTWWHRCIRLTVDDSEDRAVLLLDVVEAEALIAALTEAVRMIQAGVDDDLAVAVNPWPDIVVCRMPWSEDRNDGVLP